LAWYVDSIRLATAGCGVDEMRRFLPSWSEDQLRLRAEWLHTCDAAAMVRSYNDFHDTDIHVDLPRISAPTLLVIAGKAGVIRDEDAEEITRLLPGVTITTVANSGHMIPWDNFDGFFQAINPFLAG
jgi:N-formylmaleamate deformylase